MSNKQNMFNKNLKLAVGFEKYIDSMLGFQGILGVKSKLKTNLASNILEINTLFYPLLVYCFDKERHEIINIPRIVINKLTKQIANNKKSLIKNIFFKQ